jgi:hypothetical protein
MLFKEMIAVYYENRTKPMNTFCGQNAELLTIKARGTVHIVTTSIPVSSWGCMFGYHIPNLVSYRCTYGIHTLKSVTHNSKQHNASQDADSCWTVQLIAHVQLNPDV